MKLMTNNWELVKNLDVRIANITLSKPYTPLIKTVNKIVNSFYYVVEGEFLLSISDKHYIVKAGQLALLPKGEKDCKLFYLKPLTLCVVEFTSTIEGVDVFEKFNLNCDNHIVTVPSSDEFVQLCQRINSGNDSNGTVSLISHTADVMTMIAIYVNERALDSPSNYKQLFYPIVSYMSDHLDAEMSNSFLSKLIFMEQDYFVRKFKQAFAQTPMKYFYDLRVKRAAELLAYTDNRILDVGISVGMNDSAYFSRFFSKYCGLSPKEYRTACKISVLDSSESSTEKSSHLLQGVSIVPENIYFQNPHIFWVEDFVFTNDFIYFVVEGEFALLMEGRHYVVKQHQAAFLPKGKRVIYSLTASQNLSFYKIGFETSINGVDLLEHLNFLDNNYVVDISQADKFISICKNAIHNKSVNKNISFHIRRIADMVKLVEMYVREREKVSLPKAAIMFKPALEHMKSNLDGSVSISNLSEIMSMEPTYFIRKFKKYFKQSPMKYYDTLRAEKAAFILLTTNTPIKEVGAHIGIFDYSYFIQFFKKTHQVTPNEYKQLFDVLDISRA